jgi:hypothetical protein
MNLQPLVVVTVVFIVIAVVFAMFCLILCDRLRDARRANDHLARQIAELAAFMLSLDCGFPTINDEYPDGMSATEAAREYIRALRRKLPLGDLLRQAVGSISRPRIEYAEGEDLGDVSDHELCAGPTPAQPSHLGAVEKV